MSVTIKLPGRVIMTPQECGENPQNYEKHVIMLNNQYYDKKTKKSYFKREPLVVQTRKCIPAYQSINMSSDAYRYMTSNSCPEWFYKGASQWKKLSSAQKLEEHLTRTCKSLGGESFTYIIFKD